MGPDRPLMFPMVATSSFQSLPESRSLPTQLATPGKGWEDESPCTYVKWPAEKEESGTPGVIGRMSEAAAAFRGVNGWSSPRVRILVTSSCTGIFVFVYE